MNKTMNKNMNKTVNNKMKKTKQLLSLMLCLSMTAGSLAGLTGCGSQTKENSETASPAAVAETRSNQALFVQAYLDLLCKQDFATYADACGFEVSDVEEAYPDMLENVIELFLTYEFSEEEHTKFQEELKKIFNKCDYEVKDSIENENGTCTVPVVVRKLSVFRQAINSANKKYEKWAKKQSEDADEIELTDQFIEYVIEGCEEALLTPEYKEASTVNITLTPSSDDPNIYNYNPNDLGSLQSFLVDFGAWDKDVEDMEDDTDAEEES